MTYGTAPRLLIWATLAAGFTAIQIHQSLHQGRLALPMIHDDVGYFQDAQWRLLNFYTHGTVRLISDYIHAPPHSPASTGLAFLGFALLGFRDWAPAVMNGLIVFGLLLFLDHRGRGLPMAWLVPVAVFILTWPVVGLAVVESRPDILCALATAATVVLMTGSPWIAAPPRHHYVTGGCAGLALLAKPSISPITILVLLSAAIVVTWTEVRRQPIPTAWASILRVWIRCVGMAVLIAGPHYLVGARSVLHFLLDIASGTNALLDWQAPDGPGAQFTYFLTGPAGGRFMGPWLYLWALLALLASGVAWFNRDRAAAWRAASTLAVGLVAFALVTIPRRKSPFLGVLVTALFLVTAIEMLLYASRARRTVAAAGIRAGIGLVAGVTVTALLMFSFPAAPPLEGDGPEPTAREIQGLHRRIDQVTSVLLRDDRRPLDVFMTAYLPYLNADTVTYYLYKQPGRIIPAHASDYPPRMLDLFFSRHGDWFHPEVLTYFTTKYHGRGIVVGDLHFSDSIPAVATAIEAAHYVIALSLDYGGLFPWLPSTRIQKQVRTRIDADPSLRLVAEIGNELGPGRLLVYRRNTLFEGVSAETGLYPSEGPYPAHGLPIVRWGLRDRTSFTVFLPPVGVARLIVEAATVLPDQALSVRFDDRPVHHHHFEPRTQHGPLRFERFEVPLSGPPGPHQITFAYDRWQEPSREDQRPLAVLFRRIEVGKAP